MMHGEKYPLAKVGPDYIVFAEGVELPPGEAVVCVSIDGRVRQWKVMIPEFVVPFDPVVRAINIKPTPKG